MLLFEMIMFSKLPTTNRSLMVVSLLYEGAVTEGALDDEKEANCEKRLNSVAVPSL